MSLRGSSPLPSARSVPPRGGQPALNTGARPAVAGVRSAYTPPDCFGGAETPMGSTAHRRATSLESWRAANTVAGVRDVYSPPVDSLAYRCGRSVGSRVSGNALQVRPLRCPPIPAIFATITTNNVANLSGCSAAVAHTLGVREVARSIRASLTNQPSWRCSGRSSWTGQRHHRPCMTSKGGVCSCRMF